MLTAPRFLRRDARRALLVSGWAGATMRYRIEHLAEQLRILGWRCDVRVAEGIGTIDPGRYALCVLHRLSWSPAADALVRALRRRGCPVLFDLDDRVFHAEHAADIRSPELAADRAGWHVRLRGIGEMLSCCDAALASTEPLAEEIRASYPGMPVFVHRNAASGAMLKEASRLRRRRRGDTVRILYASGSPTHDGDILVCAPMLAETLRRNAGVRVIFVGPVTVPEDLQPFREHLEIHAHRPWPELLRMLACADLAIAPLETNVFTACKSEVKYIEAGLAGVPVIAGNTEAFRHATGNGRRGLLCGSPEAWHEAFALLVERAALRRQMGGAAERDVLARYAPRARAKELENMLEAAAGCPAGVDRQPVPLPSRRVS